MSDDVERVRAAVSLVDLVTQTVPLKKAGRNWSGLCPFHEDRNPSMTVSEERGRYRCWSCGATGDAFNWVMETQRVDFREALEILAKRAGITLEARDPRRASQEQSDRALMAAAMSHFQKALLASPEAIAYCEARGISQEDREAWKLGFSPAQGGLAEKLRRKGVDMDRCEELFLVRRDDRGGWYDRFRSRLIFPIMDHQGRPIAFGGRIIGEGQPKYINSSDTPLYRKSRVLYGLNAAKHAMSESGMGILVEGYLDVIACHRAGLPQAVASLGTSLTAEHAEQLAKWASRRVVILYDRDEAGQKAAEKAAEILLPTGCAVRIARPQPGEDPDSVLKEKGPARLREIVEQAVSLAEFRLSRVQETMDPLDDGYWDAVAEALSWAADRPEIDALLIPAARGFPGALNEQGAHGALRRMASTARKRRLAGAARPAAARAAGPKRLAIPPLEWTALRAVFSPEGRELWRQERASAEWFASHVGRRLAGAAISALPGPEAGLNGFLDSIEDEKAREVLEEQWMAQEAEPMMSESAGALARLREMAADRKVREGRSSALTADEGLAEYNRRLRERHQPTEEEAPAKDAEDPFA